jgi:hypothetical protein
MLKTDGCLFLYRHKDNRDQQYQKLTDVDFQDKMYLVTDRASSLIHILLRGRTVQMFGHTFLIKIK